MTAHTPPEDEDPLQVMYDMMVVGNPDVQLAEMVLLSSVVPIQWDRCAGPPEARMAFGWIQRNSGRAPSHDFVVIQWLGTNAPSVITSSAKYSDAFQHALFSNLPAQGHYPCRPIREVYPNADAKLLLRTSK